MTIPFLDVQSAYMELKAEIEVAVMSVLRSGVYIGGPEVTAFEEKFANYCGASYCVGVSNGLSALYLSLRAMEVGPGDEVIVASNSFIATVLAVTMTGAEPVFVEPDATTCNMDPQRVERAITSRTRVLLPTHLYGQPVDLDPLLDIAGRHGLRLIEDAAQAHGAAYKGRRIGAHGDAATWSFYPSKNLGAFGDAGAVTTNDPELAQRIRMFGNYGSSTRYVHELQGVNARLDPLQAAILSVKLDYLDEWNERRRSIATTYGERLSSAALTLPRVPAWADPAWHLYVVQHRRRDVLQARLAEQGVQTLIHYPIPPHLQRAYAALQLPAGSFPVAEELANRVLSLPMGPHLTEGQVEAVVAASLAAAEI